VSGPANPGRANPSRRPSPNIRRIAGRSSRTACACASPVSAARNRPTERRCAAEKGKEGLLFVNKKKQKNVMTARSALAREVFCALFYKKALLAC
jgi:hypothetical protein